MSDLASREGPDPSVALSPWAWQELPAPRSAGAAPSGRVLPGIVVRALALLVAGYLAHRYGDTRRAQGYVALAIVSVPVSLALPKLSRWADRLLARVARLAGLALVQLGAVIADLAVATPAAVLVRASRYEPLTGLRRNARSLWRIRSERPDRPDTGYSRDLPGAHHPTPSGRLAWPRVSTVAAVIGLIVLVDVCIGGIWQAVNPWNSGAAPEHVATLPPAAPPMAKTAAIVDPPDRRANLSAYAGQPWAKEMFRDYQLATERPDPVLSGVPNDIRSQYLNITDGRRLSYEPAATNVPEIWFFGGSTMYGEGQRDLYTISSEFARVAEAAGHPVRVVNYGVRGYTAFQEAMLLEQALASGHKPALIVIYDGANDAAITGQQPATGQPNIFDTPYFGPGSDPAPISAARAWANTSFVGSILLRIAGQHDFGLPPRTSDAVRLQNGLDVYQRSMRLSQDFAADAHVPLVNFFQPARFYDEIPVARQFRQHLPPGLIDISHAYDRTSAPLWIDGVHTNELGARLSAEAMYEHLAPQIAALSPTRS